MTVCSEEKASTLRHLVESALRDHESALVHYTAGLLQGDWERARDVVQDAFLKLCRQDPDLVGGQVKGWLFTVCRNRAYDLHRRDRRWRGDEEALDTLHAPEPDPAEAWTRGERMREVMDSVRRLPDNQRDVILLRYQQNLSYKEIADVTGLNSGTIGFLLHEALKTLRADLERRQRRDDAAAQPKSPMP